VIDQQAYEQQVQARADEMLDAVAQQERQSAWSAHSILARSHDDQQVIDAVARSLAQVVPGAGDGGMGGPFHILPAICCIVVGKPSFLRKQRT